MENRWRKAKVLLLRNICVFSPSNGDRGSSSHGRALLPPPSMSDISVVRGSSGVAQLAPHAAAAAASVSVDSPAVEQKRSRSKSRSSKGTCAICLSRMRRRHAVFKAECSHTFHLRCIVSNVKHGNQTCPVCRAKWNKTPLEVRQDGNAVAIRRFTRASGGRDGGDYEVNRSYNPGSIFHPPDRDVYDDDEPLDLQAHGHPRWHVSSETVEIMTEPEFQVARSVSVEEFNVLVHVRAPRVLENAPYARAPIDLVTVLDVSGSMAGTKLALLKRAMGFVIQNLGPSDRLAVVAFSSTARRVLSLRRMSDSGRQQSLLSVNSLVAGGGTDIAGGLRKADKLIRDRRERNPVCSVLLLSDGQDSHGGPCFTEESCSQVPVHTFGFGADHDAAALHSISENSGGTFSFVEAEPAIQDAFAQCIGGLLSVVVQDLRLELECCPLVGARLNSIKAGSYAVRISAGGAAGSIEVGDMYAEEVRNFLVSLNLPSSPNEVNGEAQVIMKIRTAHKDPLSKETTKVEDKEVIIQRPTLVGKTMVSVAVDRQRNRFLAAEAMNQARSAAERGSFPEAVRVLEDCRSVVMTSAAFMAGDQVSLSLNAELREAAERMADRRRYEESGRAYVLSGLSSHSWQRATARGGAAADSTASKADEVDDDMAATAYQTPSMLEMLQRSHVFVSSPPAITGFSDHSAKLVGK